MEKKGSILVADDNPDSREILSTVLQTWGYEVQLARDGQEALLTAERCFPSIVLSDLRMPKLNGIELMRALRQRVPECAIILITAQADIDLALEVTDEGAVEYITKPIDYDKLQALLDKTFDRIAKPKTEGSEPTKGPP